MGRLYLIGGGVAVVVAAAIGAWWLIDSRARLAVQVETQDAHIEAWERVNDADVGNADPGDDREWLQSRGKGPR